jgi:hypothetical protein
MLCVLWYISTKRNGACDVNTSVLYHSILPFKLLVSVRRTKKFYAVTSPCRFQPCAALVGASVLNGIGRAVAQLVEALRYKSEGRGFDSRLCHF